MAHDNYVQMISLSLDAQLDEADNAVLMRHIDECVACKSAWASMRDLDSLFGQVAMVRPPRDFSRQVMGRVAARRERRRLIWTIVWSLLVALVAGVVVLDPGLVSEGLLAALPTPIVAFIEPGLDVMRTVGTTLGALRDGFRVWLSYVVSQPEAQIIGLTTLALAATWLGLVGVLGSDLVEPGAREVA